ncbi:MAG: carbohydrate ABC transporter permease [Lachnospiraceae bacterium]|nr:carbohydrate ABC transporter permease [Lachnospiraceae bacterium]
MYNGKKRHKVSGQVALNIILILLAAVAFLPVLLIFIISISSEKSIANIGYSFFPESLSLDGYAYLGTFLDQLVRAYLVTIFETVVGTVWTIFLCAMFGYVLSRKNFRLRGFLSVFLLITMLFNGGTMANYMVKAGVYGLRNNLLVLILPGVNAYTCIVMRTFIQSNVPDSLIESAKIDGAGEFYIFGRIVLPLIIPVSAAMGYMQAVGHWNQWYTSYLYIDNPKLSSLQLILIKIQKNIDYLQNNVATLSPEEYAMLEKIPDVPTRMAILMIILAPILVLYPYFQKYFIKGIVVGAVKG